jgi:hypothetical protein
MGLNLGALVGIGVGLVTGNPALGAAAGSLFGGGGGGGGVRLEVEAVVVKTLEWHSCR